MERARAEREDNDGADAKARDDNERRQERAGRSGHELVLLKENGFDDGEADPPEGSPGDKPDASLKVFARDSHEHYEPRKRGTPTRCRKRRKSQVMRDGMCVVGVPPSGGRPSWHSASVDKMSCMEIASSA